MESKILEKLIETFENTRELTFNGKEIVEVISKHIEMYTIPENVLEAQRRIKICHADMGFMGSPSYYEDKKTLNNYFKSLGE